jgi:hypothetical protein
MFSARVHIILIPSISEYEAAGLASFLWWDDDDYKDFKQSALNEVKDFMIAKSITDSKEAIRILYQEIYSNELEMIVEREEKNNGSHPLNSDTIIHRNHNHHDMGSLNTADGEFGAKVKIEKRPKCLNEDCSHRPSMESKHYEDGSHAENFSVSVRSPSETECPVSKNSQKGGMIVILSDGVTHREQSEAAPDVPSFASKTDVEMIHEKSNELSTKDSLSKLQKLHPSSSLSSSERLLHSSTHSGNSATVASSVKEGAAVSPLALICS